MLCTRPLEERCTRPVSKRESACTLGLGRIFEYSNYSNNFLPIGIRMLLFIVFEYSKTMNSSNSCSNILMEIIENCTILEHKCPKSDI